MGVWSQMGIDHVTNMLTYDMEVAYLRQRFHNTS